MERDERSEPPRSPPRRQQFCGHGCTNGEGHPTTRCFPPAGGASSAQTPWSTAWPSTSPSPSNHAPACGASDYHLTCYGIPVPSPYCRQASTSRSSRSGSDTRRSEPPRSTSTPTSPSKSAPLPAPHLAKSSPDVIGQPTPCSPSSRGCDYADLGNVTRSPPQGR